jgi:1-acyl-sn-glycerol-3-phosphate acyltransferase
MIDNLRLLRRKLNPGRLTNFIFRKALVLLYYRRVSVLHPERLPAGGPVLYVGLHRNGAVDGFVYSTVLPRAVFMISAQLRAGLLGKLFFNGIQVSRTADRKRGITADNREAVEACVRQVAEGGELFIMPEGSSDLGFRHLPFHKGAARILEALISSGTKPEVIPIGLHYEKAWAWQSKVEVVVGNPVSTELPGGVTAKESVRILHGRITEALEEVGINAPDAGTFAGWEKTAYAATVGTGRSFFGALKALEQGLPEPGCGTGGSESGMSWDRLFKHQGVPLVPERYPWAQVLFTLLLAPPVIAMLLANMPPLLAGWLAGRRLADGTNTIALWRLLVGFSVLLLWSAGLLALAAACGGLPLWGAYLLVSCLGLRSVHRLKILLVSLGNLFRAPGLRPELLAWRHRLDRAMSDIGA